METFEPFIEGCGIELGAGQGTMSTRIIPLLNKIDLVEPSSNLFEILEQKFSGDDSLRLYHMSLEEFVRHAEPASKDVTIMVNVLEHIKDDRIAIDSVKVMLKPGGHLLLFVPALRQLYSEFDRLVGHYRRYHKEQLEEIITSAGLEVVVIRYCDFLGVFPWFILNKILRGTSLNPFLAKLYDAVGVPVTRFIERRINPPFGKNLILVARRPK
tara:strand:- start:2 stop:640 length:639 start_codon:yes stop_codon:yes gene_type:complete